jgi:geranylgeranyl diphosphate synthase type II
MVGGQYLDVAPESEELNAGTTKAAGESVPPGDSLRLLHSLKTGRLIQACVHCGGLLAEAPAEELKKLRGFAAELGLLFQIKDDILDVIGETAILGKQAGSDERLDRLTYVSAYGLKESERLALEARQRALAALDKVKGSTGFLAGITNYIYERRH